MSSKCTLQDLLQLALRTPEIGAVNFNYLYQVIHEILEHLEILDMPATVSNELVGGIQLASDGYIPLAITQGGHEVERVADGVSDRSSSRKEGSYTERKEDGGGDCVRVIEDRAKNDAEKGMIGAQRDTGSRKSRAENDFESETNSGQSEIEDGNNGRKSSVKIVRRKSAKKSIEKIRISKTKDDVRSEQGGVKPDIEKKQDAVKTYGEREQDGDKIDSEGIQDESKIDGTGTQEESKIDGEREKSEDKVDREREQDECKIEDKREQDGGKLDVGKEQERGESGTTETKNGRNDAPIKDKSKVKKVMLINGGKPPKKDNDRRQFVVATSQRPTASLHVLRLSMSDTSPSPPRRPAKVTKTTSERGLQTKRNVVERAPIDWQAIVTAVKNSKTPASDLWQILNTSRRLEAAEDTINGISSFIDSISSDLSEFRDAVDRKLTDGSKDVKEGGSDVCVTSKDVGYMTDDRNSKTPSDSEGMLVSKCVDELSRTLTSSIKQLEDRINVCATKKELEDFCSSPTVASIIEDRIKSAPLQKGNEGDKGDVENTEDGGNTAIEEKPITRRESRTKLLHMAMSRIGKVEELVSMLTEELQKVESLLDLKSDKINEDVIAKLNTKIKQLTDDIMKQQPSNEEFSGMQNHIEKINSESKALKFKTEQSFKEQTEVCKKVHKLEIELGHLTESVYKRFGSSKDSSMSRSEEDGLQKIRKMLSSLQDAHKRLETQVLGMNRAVQESTKRLSTIDTALEDIQENKVNKDFLNKILELKADKTVVDQKVSQSNFDSVMINVERNLQCIIQKADEQETKVNQVFATIEVRLERKMDREEFEKLKRNLEIQLKRVEDNVQDPTIPEDGAAGFRKPLLRDFHCISCDKPVEILQQEAIPSLSLPQSLPGNRSIRPYTTFELDDIRKNIRGASNKDRFELTHEREQIQRHFLRLCGAHDLDALALQSSRACGGSHTMLDVQKRALFKATMLYREDTFPIMLAPDGPIESEVIGRDGRIYRARQEHLPPLIQQTQKTNLQSNSDVPKVTMPSIHQGRPDDYSSPR